MNEHDLLDAVGGIDGKYVDKAGKKKAKKKKFKVWYAVGLAAAAALVVLLGITIAKMTQKDGNETTQQAKDQTKPSKTQDGIQKPTLTNVAFTVDYDDASVNYTPSVAPYQANADLSNVRDADRYYFVEEEIEKLAKNNFVVTQGQSAEFFDIYEGNRYSLIPNFITTDSMMHTYHLYFAMLQKKVEKNSLCAAVEKLSGAMLENSKKQYEALKGSEWEEAAKLNVAYFGIATRLLDGKDQIPDYASDIVEKELQKIMSASGIETSLIMNDYEDYSQYKPRGYYDGDEQLEKYFRAMMLYGHVNFIQKSETMNRCALLMTIAMNGHL